MRFQKIDFSHMQDDGQEHKVSIIIAGVNPELMINEHQGDDSETVQVHSMATHALYKALHKIYLAKT